MLIKDDDLPPSKWLLGRVLKLIKGSDGLVRALEIKTKTRIYTRAVQYIVLLPVESDLEQFNAQENADDLSENIHFVGLEYFG